MKSVPLRLSLSGFLFEEDYQRQSLSLQVFCRLAADCGYEGVELRRTQLSVDASRQQRQSVHATVVDHGLQVSCLTARGLPAGGAARDLYFRKYLDLCNDLQCPTLKIGAEPAWMRQAIEVAAAAGVTLACNNHVGGALATVVQALEYFAEVGDDRFGLLFDPMHLHAGGDDCVEAARQLAPHLLNTLVHSIRRADSPHTATMETALGHWARCLPDDDGAQDWPGILRQLRMQGFTGWMTVIESGWPPQQRQHVARHCADFLRRNWSHAERMSGAAGTSS